MSINSNICIDFGTSNTVLSYILPNSDKIEQILNDTTGDSLIPTTIFFIPENITIETKIDNLVYGVDYYIGSTANELFNSYKKTDFYFYQFKRFLGMGSRSINIHKDFLSKYNIEYTTDEDTIYFYLQTIDSELKLKISVINLIKLFFKGLNQIIKSKLSLTNNNIPVIITCPAYFHDMQRSQLKKAAEDADFTIFKIYNEPTAAAIYYINKNYSTNNIIYENAQSKPITLSTSFIVYDLGGGTIDTTVVEYHNEHNTCEIIDIDGNNSLGGIDIDNLLIYDIYDKFLIDKTNNKFRHKIRMCAEEIKIKLTYSMIHNVYMENVPQIINNEIIITPVLKISYTRHQFNNLMNEIIELMIEPIRNMYNKYKITDIIFIGGPTQIPLLQNKVNALISSNTKMNEIILNKQGNQTLYKTIVSQGGSMMYKLIINESSFCLLDIIPMNIGISDPDNNLIIMIDKNSKVPSSVEKTFSTSHDCQRSINIDVYEGIDKNCNQNTWIGGYKIINIPPLPRAMILIKLLFKISYNGILNISINGFKNPSDDSAKSFDFKLCSNIKLISNTMVKDLLKKILLNGKK